MASNVLINVITTIGFIIFGPLKAVSQSQASP